MFSAQQMTACITIEMLWSYLCLWKFNTVILCLFATVAALFYYSPPIMYCVQESINKAGIIEL